MSATPTKDPLDVLQAMFNEVLVQTGKAIKASQRDGARNGPSTGGALRTKMPETMKTYHYALDDLESEITRAKAVLLRDLEKLRAARAPVPAPSPVAPPAPMAPEPQQPTAVMMDMPSAAAHTVSSNIHFQPVKEESKRAPFPDMGMGLTGDAVDLSSTTKPLAPSPRSSTGVIKSGAGSSATPPIKQSPKPTPSMKATPIPTPQPAVQPAAIGPTAQKATPPQPQPPATQTSQDSSLDAMLALPPTGGAATADMTGGELNFTNMEFTLAPPSDGQSQNAPPAPMQDFDLSSFTAQDGGADLLSMDDMNGANNTTNPPLAEAPGTTPGKAADNTTSANNLDSIYDLNNIDGNVDHMDLDLSLGGGGEINDSTFNDLFYEDNDAGMGQFDEAYFGLE